MFVATHATRSTKLHRSGMKSVRSHMPLLWSLARRLGALAIDMALLAELGLPAVRKDKCKVQPPRAHLTAALSPASWLRGAGKRAGNTRQLQDKYRKTTGRIQTLRQIPRHASANREPCTRQPPVLLKWFMIANRASFENIPSHDQAQSFQRSPTAAEPVRVPRPRDSSRNPCFRQTSLAGLLRTARESPAHPLSVRAVRRVPGAGRSGPDELQHDQLAEGHSRG